MIESASRIYGTINFHIGDITEPRDLKSCRNYSIPGSVVIYCTSSFDTGVNSPGSQREGKKKIPIIEIQSRLFRIALLFGQFVSVVSPDSVKDRRIQSEVSGNHAISENPTYNDSFQSL